jgi:hypothetical protein
MAGAQFESADRKSGFMATLRPHTKPSEHTQPNSASLWPAAWLSLRHRARARFSRVDACFLVILLTICGVTAFIGAVPTQVFGHDAFFLLDNGWRSVCGQRPQLDYFSPWGPVTFLIVGFGLKLAHYSADGIGYGTALVALVTGLWAYWLGRKRLAPVLRVLFGIAVTMLVAAPYSLGKSPLWSSHAMVYNRYGYALLALVLLECFGRVPRPEPGDGAANRELLGGISTGVVVGILLFLKASYFAVALPIVAVSFLFRQANFRRTCGLALGCGVATCALLAYMRFDVLTMVNALRMAAGARSKRLYSNIFASILVDEVPAMLLAISMAIAARSRQRARSLLTRHLPLILTLLVLAADTLLTFTNMQSNAAPLTGLLPILVAGFVLDDGWQLPLGRARRVLPRLAFWLASGCSLFVPPLASDVAGLWYGARQKAHPMQSRISVRFSEPRLASLILYNGSLDIAANGGGYTTYVNEGVALLRKHCTSQDRVLTMDMVNPFPYALGWRPPLGGAAAIAFDYTLSAENRPSFDQFFGDTTVVMVPKRPALGEDYLGPFNRLFMPEVLRRYILSAESDLFWLYTRK